MSEIDKNQQDVEGHVRKTVTDQPEDIEGHVRWGVTDEGEDTEGHVQPPRDIDIER